MEPTADELVALEHQGWEALASGPEAALAFYREVLADDVVMLFPGGFAVTDRAQILEAMAGEPWAWFRLEDVRALELASGAGVVTARATAQRTGQPEYRALTSSAYAHRQGRWQMVLHQQTPY